jgi:predicted nucleic acid-binding protein
MMRVQSGQIHGYISTHGLAESYSVLTRLPIKPKPSVEQIAESLFDLLNYFETISLFKNDYRTVIQRLSNLNLPGGVIFDALHAQAALKSNVDVLLTLNPKDFNRFGEDIASIVKVPG